MKVLIVDDERHVIEGLKYAINWAEIGITKIIDASEGTIGWEKFLEERPDVVITDVHMQPMNGIELVSRIREIDKDVPVIIFSGYNDFEYACEAITFGVVRYLLKPSVPEEIEQVIVEALDEVATKKKQSMFIEDFNKNIEQNLRTLRGQFFEELFATGFMEESSVEQNIHFLRIDPSIVNGGIVLAIKLYKEDLQMDNLEMQWYGIRFSIASIIKQVINRHTAGYVINGVEDTVIAIICNQNTGQFLEDAIELGNTIVEDVWNSFHIKLNIGIGNMARNLSELGNSQRGALASVEMSEENGYNQVILFNTLDKQSVKYSNYYINEMNHMSECLVKGEIERATTEWSRIKESIINDQVPVANLKTLGMWLINLFVLKETEEVGKLDSVEELISSMDTMRNKITKQEMVVFLEDTVEEMIRIVQKHYSEIRCNRYVAYIQEYVSKHYGEDIYFSQLAKEMNISKNYLSNVFKKETGTSFINYLTGFRIEKAKELLRTNVYLICEVTELVGYNDSAYFSRIFKQVEGCSPLEYMRKFLL